MEDIKSYLRTLDDKGGRLRFVAAAEYIEELEARLGGICGYPFCVCKPANFCMVLNGPVPDVVDRKDLIEAHNRIEELKAAIKLLTEKLGGHQPGCRWHNNSAAPNRDQTCDCGGYSR